MEFVRLFTAVYPPEPASAMLREVQKRLRAKLSDNLIGWVAEGNMHVTLQFLGDVVSDRLQDVVGAMAAGVGETATPGTEDRWESNRSTGAELHLSRTGAFPTISKPRVIWVGLKDSTGMLADVQRAVNRRLSDAGFPIDSRPFQPHVTLGYVRRRVGPDDRRRISAAIAGTEVVEFPFAVSELVLVRSVLSSSGAVHSAVHSIALSPASNRTSSGDNALE